MWGTGSCRTWLLPPPAPPSPRARGVPFGGSAQMPPGPLASQKMAGAPNVYVGLMAVRGSTPRCRAMSMSREASEPPREWPMKATRAKGELARWSSSSGSKRAYSSLAASYTPRCTCLRQGYLSSLCYQEGSVMRHVHTI